MGNKLEPANKKQRMEMEIVDKFMDPLKQK